MPVSIQDLLTELEAFGEHNDSIVTERPLRMLNITRDTGEFLAVQVRATQARHILEIGTSNGYSTLWLATAASQTNGHVTTIETLGHKVELAANNFERAGLAGLITLVHADAGEVLKSSQAASYDLIFLDSKRSEYLGWWPDIKRVLRRGGLLIVDNAVSHPADMADFVASVRADADLVTCTVPVGKGEFMATWSSPLAS